MNAIVFLNKKKATIILTEVNNIDWEEKELIDVSDIDEIEYLLDDTISVFDIEQNKSTKIKVNDLNEEKHQLIIDKKRFVALHVLK